MRLQVLQRLRSLNRDKPALAATALAIALSLAGCSSDGDEGPPVACKEGPDAIRTALERAPQQVDLDGEPLSACFARGADASDVQQVGAAYVTVASRLAAEARLDPDGPDALRLGYLIGAARRGASDTQGIHDELLRRVEQELTGINTSTGSYRRGYEAGRSRG
jgi:hypothetical protein